MPDQANDGAAVHERFVTDCREMDLAWADGRFDEWLQEKVGDERNAADVNPAG